MTKLSVNLNKVATAAQHAHARHPERRGARPHRARRRRARHHACIRGPTTRHIRARRRARARAAAARTTRAAEFNIEGNPFENALDARARGAAAPVHAWCPDDPAQALPPTTAGTSTASGAARARASREVKELGVRVSLFMDADARRSMRAARAPARRSRRALHRAYAEAFGTAAAGDELGRSRAAAARRRPAGCDVNAGHDLNQREPAAVPARRARRARSLDRACAHRRCAGRRPRDRRCATNSLRSAPAHDLRHRHRRRRAAPHRAAARQIRRALRAARADRARMAGLRENRQAGPVSREPLRREGSVLQGDGHGLPLSGDAAVHQRRAEHGRASRASSSIPISSALVQSRGIVGHHVTISDEKRLACACVVLERQRDVISAEIVPLGPVVIDVAGHGLTDEDRRRLAHPLTGGVILFARNYASPEQLAAADGRHPRRARAAARHRSGSRRRAGAALPRRIHGASAHARAGTGVGRNRQQRARGSRTRSGYVLAAELRAHGVDLTFAPVLDVDHGGSSVIGDRAFHRDPEASRSSRAALVQGLQGRRAWARSASISRATATCAPIRTSSFRSTSGRTPRSSAPTSCRSRGSSRRAAGDHARARRLSAGRCAAGRVLAGVAEAHPARRARLRRRRLQRRSQHGGRARRRAASSSARRRRSARAATWCSCATIPRPSTSSTAGFEPRDAGGRRSRGSRALHGRSAREVHGEAARRCALRAALHAHRRAGAGSGELPLA